MLTFNAFDPYARLAEQTGGAAKLAKHAKPNESSTAPILAALASLARQRIQSRTTSDASCTWRAEDWRVFFSERAAIAEYDGATTRDEAESIALQCCIACWLNTHPPAHKDGICPYCQKPAVISGAATPAIIGTGMYVWLHHHCLERWLEKRRHDAANALAAIGIGTLPYKPTGTR